MYERFYNLKTKPFRLSPDPRFLYQSPGHAKALAYLRYGLQTGEGFVVITGEVGAGKTTLARALLNGLQDDSIVAAQLVTTHLGEDELVRAICNAFGLRTGNEEKAQLLKRLESFLLARAREGKRALLVVDEAQNLPPKSLEELRMLSNYQVGERALLQSFLLGQAQFKKVLQSPDMEQFRQRVIVSYHLGPLEGEETRKYIEHRLNLVGWRRDPVITDEAYGMIHEASGGIPRKINTLCDRLFLYGCLEEIHEINEDVVGLVVDEQRRQVSEFTTIEGDAGAARSAAGEESPEGDVPAPAAVVSMPGEGELERRVAELERRIEMLEERVRKDRDRIQKLIMMAVLSGEDFDFSGAMEILRKAE